VVKYILRVKSDCLIACHTFSAASTSANGWKKMHSNSLYCCTTSFEVKEEKTMIAIRALKDQFYSPLCERARGKQNLFFGFVQFVFTIR
jgi:hypothetical protein